MELADVTDSKSVGSNTVRVRPPPSAPKKQPSAFAEGCFFGIGGWEEPALCGSCKEARRCLPTVSQGCETIKASAVRHPAVSSSSNTAEGCFLSIGGWEEPALCGSCKEARRCLPTVSQGCETSKASTVRHPAIGTKKAGLCPNGYSPAFLYGTNTHRAVLQGRSAVLAHSLPTQPHFRFLL